MSTLIAVGGGLAALPAAALELGEAQVNSSLGQPLRASISYALAPHESLQNTCVSLQGASPQSVMPGIGPATISVADGIISIAGKTAIREPLVTMRVNIRCAYTPNLSREYMLFVDPVGTPAQAAATQGISAPVAVQPVAVQPVAAAPTPVATRRRPVTIEPIDIGTRHRVQPGESLSEIAQSIVDRPIGLWAAVGEIFDANPEAFIDNDPNKLKAGSWLIIPDFGVDATTATADAKVFSSEQPATAYPGFAEEIPAADPVQETADVTETVAATEEVAEGIEAVEDNPYVTPSNSVGETVVSIPDTTLDAPVATSSSPNVPTAQIQPTVAPEPATNWWLWLALAGGGIVIIAALLFFGRRGRFGSAPIGAAAAPQRRRSDVEDDTHKLEAVSEIEIELDELSATHENLALDADLIVGTGLQDGNDMDVAQDFGFAASGTQLDMELPEEMSSGGDSTSNTDIIPPMNIDADSILENEVLPDEEQAEDDDYDMSVIVDATKMPLPEDVTQKDLEAIPVETSDETLITGDYTVSHEVDYKVLEQDYEDELTATQALNVEISRAAAELAESLDNQTDDEEETKNMTLASVTALDVTAQLPANNDDISDLDDTGINEAVTVNMQDTDNTVEMPADDSENTIEMPSKKGRSA
ncbi:MAG: type IV pilus assembly protein FimV [Woeseiaceae bacterium]